MKSNFFQTNPGCDIEFETTSAEMELGELPPGSHCTLKIVNPLGSNFSLGALYKFDDDDDFLKVKKDN